jgi:hypothetical protein
MEFPKYIYLRLENQGVLVRTAAEEARHGTLGVEYAARPWPEDQVEHAVAAEPGCPKCAAMIAKFDASWKSLSGERDSLKARVAELEAELAATTEGRDAALQSLVDSGARKADAPAKQEPKADEPAKAAKK